MSTPKKNAGEQIADISLSEFNAAVKTAAEAYRAGGMAAGVDAHSAMTIDKKVIRASTFACAISVPFDCDIKMTVNGRTLARIVDNIAQHGGDKLQLKQFGGEAGGLSLTSGRINAEMVCRADDAIDPVDIKTTGDMKVDSESRAKIVEGIEQALQAAGTDDIRNYLNGVVFAVEGGALCIYGCDGLSLVRANTGLKGFGFADGITLNRDTAEAFVAIASRVGAGDDTLMCQNDKENRVFGYRFAGGIEMRASMMEVPDTHNLLDALKKLEGMFGKSKSVAMPEGLADVMKASSIATDNMNRCIKMTVQGGKLTVESGKTDDVGLLYRTKDIPTELGDFYGGYDLSLLSKLIKNPCEQILMVPFDDKSSPIYIGNVGVTARGVGCKSYLMPMHI